MYRLTCLQVGPHCIAQLLYHLRCSLVDAEIRSDGRLEFANLYSYVDRLGGLLLLLQ